MTASGGWHGVRHPSLCPPRPTKYVPIAGTHGFDGTPDGEWWYPGSAFIVALQRYGWSPLATRPFYWTTRLGGVPWRDGHHQWLTAGMNLYSYLRPIHDEDRYVDIIDRNVIAHSHGLQVVLYACAEGLKLHSLISVMSPVRGDMRRIAEKARPNIARWVHLHSDRSDWVQIAGAVWDGAFGIYREHPVADVNIVVPKAGHSKLLRDPAWFDRWPAYLHEVAS